MWDLLLYALTPFGFAVLMVGLFLMGGRCGYRLAKREFKQALAATYRPHMGHTPTLEELVQAVTEYLTKERGEVQE